MNTESKTTETSDLREDFLAGMRYVANSVTVVTTDGKAGISGATVSAFSSVSADPPMVLVCLNAESNTLEKIRDNADFCVNVLPEGAKHIAERFAGFHDEEFPDRFDGIDVTASKGPSPVISGATAFICKLDEMVTSGSHVICLGRVIETHAGNFTPLIYMDRKFKRISDLEG
jgi:flavin reductase (DIM6/NTAB) family NADH-FMN oxidoreductase RutF